MNDAAQSDGLATAAGPAVDTFHAEVPEASAVGASTTPPPVRRRRLEAVRTPSDVATVTRAVPGQLPTFDRHYLMTELRQITIISSALLGVIIALAFLLR